jgi:hypothetical protein
MNQSGGQPELMREAASPPPEVTVNILLASRIRTPLSRVALSVASLLLCLAGCAGGSSDQTGGAGDGGGGRGGTTGTAAVASATGLVRRSSGAASET